MSPHAPALLTSVRVPQAWAARTSVPPVAWAVVAGADAAWSTWTVTSVAAPPSGVIVIDQSPSTAARISAAPSWNSGSSTQAKLGLRKNRATGTANNSLGLNDIVNLHGPSPEQSTCRARRPGGPAHFTAVRDLDMTRLSVPVEGSPLVGEGAIASRPL